MTIEQLEELGRRYSAQAEEELRKSPISAEELLEFATEQRTFAATTDSPGLRRGCLANAELCERIARERATIER